MIYSHRIVTFQFMGDLVWRKDVVQVQGVGPCDTWWWVTDA